MRLIFLTIFLFFSTNSIFFSQIKDITSNNKLVLSTKIKELQKSFYKMHRGRRYVKLVNLQEASLITKLASESDEMLKNLKTAYLVSLRELKKNISEKNIFSSDKIKDKIYNDSKIILTDIYDIEDEIKSSNSFQEIDIVINSAFLQFSFFTKKIFLYLKFLDDIKKIKNKFIEENKDEKILLEKIMSLEEEILKMINKKINISNTTSVENELKKEILKLSEKKNSFFNFAKEVKNTTDEKLENLSSDEIITYTITFEDKLLLIYGNEDIILDIKKEITKINFDSFNDVLSFVKRFNVERIETFKKIETKENVYYGTIRSAIFDNLIPIIEGLSVDDAENILSFLNYKTFRDKNFKDKTRNNIIIFSNTQPDSEIIIYR